MASVTRRTVSRSLRSTSCRGACSDSGRLRRSRISRQNKVSPVRMAVRVCVPYPHGVGRREGGSTGRAAAPRRSRGPGLLGLGVPPAGITLALVLNVRAKSPSRYLLADSVIDHAHPEVARQAAQLREGRPDDVTFARAAFDFVRDTVRHSWDAQDPRVTLSASDTLREGVGLCYAKAHLLAGLLRAQGVPSGLCYQRLTDDGQQFDVHGLVAVFLEGAWHRQDPRGNKPGVDAQFSLADERLAWPVRPELGECDYVEVFESAHPAVVAALTSTDDVLALCGGGLPDALPGATPASPRGTRER